MGVELLLFAQLPDVLHGPVPGPFVFGLAAVCAGSTGRRPRFDQVLNHEAVSPEEPDPLAVGQLEVYLVWPLQVCHAEVIVEEGALDLVRLYILTHNGDRRRGRESEKPPGPE